MNKIYMNASSDAKRVVNGFKYLLYVCVLFVAHNAIAQTTYYSKAAATDFNATASWGTAADGSGAAPASISNADSFVISNGSQLSLTANASCRLRLQNGKLTITSNTLTVERTGAFDHQMYIASTGNLEVSGGTLFVKGGMYFADGSGLIQTGGLIQLNPHSGTASTSLGAGGSTAFWTFAIGATGTSTSNSISSVANGDKFQLTGGTLHIMNMNSSTSTSSYSFISYVSSSANSIVFGSGHTLKFGDGSSTISPPQTNGFYVSVWPSSGYCSFGNVEIDLGVGGSNKLVKSLYAFPVNGNLTIGSGSELQTSTTTSSGYKLYVTGNLTNNGILSTLGVLQFGNYNFRTSTEIVSTQAQTISGTGVFRNLTTSPTANFTGLTINNTSAGGVTFSTANTITGVGTGTVSGTLNFTNGVIHTGSNTFTLGTGTGSVGTLSYTAGGFGSGSSFARWYAASGMGTTLTAGIIPSMGVGSYPFVTGNPVTGTLARHFHRNTSTFSTGGPFRVTYNDNGNGTTTITTPFTETVTYDRQTNASWTTSVISPGVLSGTTAQFCIQGEGTFANTTGNVVTLRGGAQFGTAQAGSTQPMGQRAGLTVANQTGVYTLGFASSQSPKQSVASGKWEDPSTWTGGTLPSCSDITFIMPGHTVTVDATTATANASSTFVSKTATLNLSGGVLNIGCTAGKNNDSLVNNGTLNISAGTLNINGSFDINNGSNFTHSGGNINIDGNNAGTTTNSVRNGKPIFGIGHNAAYASGTLNFTGGTITIVDPHTSATSATGATTSANYAFLPNLSALVNSVNASPSHTIQFGNGVSTDAGGATTGFAINFYNGSGRFNAGNIILNDPSSNPTTSRRVLTNVTYGLNCRGNLTITDGKFDMNILGIVLGGNVTVNDSMTASGTITFANPTGTSNVIDSIPQTVSIGVSGIVRNLNTNPTANFSGIAINNRLGFGGVTFANAFNQIGIQPANTISASGALNFTSGTATTASGVTFLLGSFGATPAVASTPIFTSGGFTSGSSFGYYMVATTSGTTITAGTTASSTGFGRFPFVSSTGSDRSVWFERPSSLSIAGFIATTYNQVSGTTTGLSIADANSYTVTQRGNDNWSFNTLGSNPTATSYEIAISAVNLFGAPLSADSTRIVQASAAIGTYQRGTLLPQGQRVLSLSDLTSGAFYIGANDNEIPNSSLQSGDWNTASTWSKGVPTCTDNAIIATGHTVTIAASGNAKNVTVQQGATLTHNAGAALTVGCTNNNSSFSINGGTFNMNAGTLTVNGKFELTSNVNGIFNQSGGDVVVDGNSGTLATSINGHICDMYSHTASTLQLTGGTFTVVDPSAALGAPRHAFKVLPSLGNTGSGPGWTLKLGNGSSTTPGGNNEGFVIEMAGSVTTNIFKISNLEINNPGATTALNRIVIPLASRNTVVNNFTLTDGVFRTNGNLYVSNNLINNDTFINNANTVFMADYNNGAVLASGNAQSISGSGYFTNNATYASKTGDLTNLTVFNNNATGVTPNMPLAISGTLTMTAGIINTTSTNILRLGTTNSGTLSGASTSSTYVNGPMERFFAVGNSPTTISSNRIPVGVNGRLLPVIINPQTTNATAGIYMRAQVFDNGTPITGGAGVSNTSNLSWQVNVSPNSIASNFEGAFIALGDSMTRTFAKLLTSSSQGGTYDGTLGGSSYISAITPNNFISQNTLIPSASWTEFFSYGDLAICPAPSSNASNISIPRVSTTAALLQFDSDPSITGYVVVVDTTGQSLTSNPIDGTTYAAGSQFGARVIGSYNTSAAAYQVAISSLSTAISPFAATPGPGYTVYIFAYNNSGCSGPTYNTTPATTSLNNCAAAPATTGLTTAPMGYANQTSSGFDIVTGTSTATYTGSPFLWLDIYTNSAKTIKHPSYNTINTGVNVSNGSPATISVSGLNPASNYWAEIFVEENGCFSSALTTNLSAIATLPSATVTSFSQNFDATPAGLWPAGWYRVSTTNATSSPTVTTSATAASSAPNGLWLGATSTTATSLVAMPAVSTLNSGTYLLKFKVKASTAGQTMTVGYLSNPSDPNSFTALSNSNATISNIGTTFVDYVISPITVPSGNTTLAFRNEGIISSSLYIDDVVYEQMPFCQVARGGTASFPTTSACGGGSTIGTAIGFNADSLGLTYNWQSSSDSLFSSPTDISSPSSLYSNLNLSNLSTPLYYRHKTTCTNGPSTQIGYSNTVLINVLNPSVTASAGGSVCGNDSALISATPSTNDSIYWFSALSGGTDLAVGQSYKTPPLSATTIYYAEATAPRPGSSFTLGTITSSSSTVSTSGSPLFTSWGGQKTQYIIRASELKALGMMPGNITGFSYPITSALRSPLVDFRVKMVHTSRNVAVSDSFITGGLTTVYSNASEPIAVGNHSITFTSPFNWDGKTNILVEIFFNHADGGTSASTITYTTTHGFSSTAYLYDDFRNTVDIENAVKLSDIGSGGTSSVSSGRPLFTFRGNGKCTSSPRTSVTATYVTPPAFSLDRSSDSTCIGSATQSATTISVGANNYTTYTWSPSSGVAGNSSSGWNFSPTTNTRYILSALDATPCKVVDTVDVRVDAIPSALALTQGLSTAKCFSALDSLMVSGGTIDKSLTLGTETTLNSTTSYPAPYSLYYGGVKHQMLILASELTAQGLTAGDSISSVTFSVDAVGSSFTGSLSSFQIDMGQTSSTALTSSSFLSGLSNVLSAQTVTIPTTGLPATLTHTFSSKFAWNGTSNIVVQTSYSNNIIGNSNTFVQMKGSATSFVSSNWYIEDGVTSSAILSATIPTSSTSRRPNMVFSANKSTSRVWSPTTGLFTNRAMTTAYSGTSVNKVYAKPSATQNYYLTAINGACFVRDSIVDSIKSATSLVTLATSNTSGAVEQCTDANGWSYYATAAKPDEWLFGIYKNGNTFTATVDINVDNANKYQKSASSVGANQEHASYIMSRYWNVNPTGTVGTGVKVRFFIDPQDITDLLDERDNDYDVLKNTTNPSTLAVKGGFEWFKTTNTVYNPTNWTGNKHNGAIVKLTEDTVATLNGQTYVELSGITSFSGGSGGSSFGPSNNGLFSNGGTVGLPVTWKDVKATVKEEGNLIQWTTSSEKNTSHFEVEYSYDAKTFYKASNDIKAAVNSTTDKLYTFMHLEEYGELVYYRIKQVDLDGKVDYSKAVVAKRTSKLPEFHVSMYPVPLNVQDLTVRIQTVQKTDITITINDLLGRGVYTERVSPQGYATDHKLSLGHLQNGTYHVTIDNGLNKSVQVLVVGK